MPNKKNPRNKSYTGKIKTNSLYSNTDKEALKEHAADYLRIQHDITNPYVAFSSPWREDKHPSCTLDRKSHKVKDWARGKSFDVFDMARLDFGVEQFPKQIEAVARVLNIPISKESISYMGKNPARKPKPRYAPRKEPEPITGKNIVDTVRSAAYDLYESNEPNVIKARKYLYERGFRDSEILSYGLCWVSHPKIMNGKWTGFPSNTAGYLACPFPSSDDWSEVRYCVFRPMFEGVGKERKPKGAAPIYFEHRLREPGQLYVCEGIFDAMSLEIMNGVRAIALCGAGGDVRLLDIFAHTPRSERPRLILALDNDDAGQKFKDSLSKGLRALGAAFKIAEPYPDGCKDANDVLQAMRHKCDVVREAETTDADVLADVVNCFENKDPYNQKASI